MSFILGVIGTTLAVSRQIAAGQQQAQVFEFNAAISEERAKLARQAGEVRVERLRRERRRFTARQTASFAKAGVRLTGSPLQVIADTAAELELDILLENFNTNIQIQSARTDADLDRIRARQARTAGFINAGTTLLSRTEDFVISQNRARIS